MAGILNYKNYLNTLQTLSNAESNSPSTQKTLTFDIQGGGADGWTADVNYSVILVDKILWKGNTPDFTNSSVIGYFPDFEGNFTEYSTGVISIPANIYQGPLLPTGEKNVPIVIINITWSKDDLTFSTNLGYVQAWEPGVALGDPYKSIFFEPIDPIASTLDLNGTELVIYRDQVSFTADSNIPISLGANNPCYFYANTGTGTNILLGESFFDDHRASITLNTEDVLTTGTWFVFAQFRGIERYGRTTSNILELEVVPGIPLIKEIDSLNPDKALYFPGDQSIYSIRVIPDPRFEPTGVEVANTMTLALVNEFPPNTATTFFSGNFVDGEASGTFTVDASMIDTEIVHTGTEWTIQSFSTATGQFVAQVLVTNDESVRTAWGYQTIGRYAAGSTSTLITVANTTTKTLDINSFNISIDVSPESTVYTEALTLFVGTTSTEYSRDVTVTAVKDAETVVVYQGNASGFSTTSTTFAGLSTGTWNLTATYPGDIGDSIFFANAPSTSNTVSHRVRAGNELDAVLSYYSTATNDILRVWASTSTTLTNTVSFFNGSTLLGTGEWIRRATVDTTQTVWYQGGPIIPGGPNITFRGDNLKSLDTAGNWNGGQGSGPGSIAANGSIGYLNTISNDIRFILGTGQQTPTWETNLPVVSSDSFLRSLNAATRALAPAVGAQEVQNEGVINPNRWRLWKYYDGTNYDMTAGTNTNIATLLDPITTGSWTVNFVESISGRELWINNNRSTVENLFANDFPVYTDYQFDVYDIYRTDDVGDYRGYNVIGIEVEDDLVRPEVSELNPHRVYFRPGTRKFERMEGLNAVFSGANLAIDWRNFARSFTPGANSTSTGVYGATQHIDLVEYIGEVNWIKPIQSNDQAAGLQPRKMNKVWLFRFTPEVRQTDTQFQTNRPFKEHLDRLPPNQYHPDGNYKVVPITTTGVYRLKDGSYRVWNYKGWDTESSRDAYYGRKTWRSRNTADLSENLYTDFCTSWFLSFGYHSWDPRGAQYSNYFQLGNGIHSTASLATIYTTTSLVSFDVQTVELVLPKGTITTTTGIHATWPGTIGLGPEYGRFAGFDIYAQLPEIDIDLSTTVVTPPSAATSTYEGGVISTVGGNANNIIYQTNPVRLTADLSVDTVKFPAATSDLSSGTVTFFNGVSNAVIGTVSVVDNQAQLVVNSNTLTNVSSSIVSVRAKYNRSGYQASTSTSMPVQVINYNSYTATNFAFLTEIFDKNYANISYGTQFFKIPQIKLTNLATITKASTGYTDGLVKIVGSFDIILPSLAGDNRPWSETTYPQGDLITRELYNEYGTLAVELFYRVDSSTAADNWVPLPLTNPSNLTLTPSAPKYLHNNRYEVQRLNNVTAPPLAVTLNINATDLWRTYLNWNSTDAKLSYDQDWSTITFAYRVLGGVPESETYLWKAFNVAALPNGAKLAHKHNISLSR